MTVSSTLRSITYNGNGSTTVFPYPFRIFEDADLVVTLIDSNGVEYTKTLTTHFTVSGADENAGGDVTMLTAPATGEQLRIERTLDETQPTDLTNQGAFYPEVHERAFDRMTMLIQQQIGAGELEDAVATAFAGLTAGTYNPVISTGATTARTLQSRFGKQLSPEDFGAAGDDTTDDTAAVQACITACCSRAAEMLLLDGSAYKCTAPLTIPSRIHVRGAGPFGGRLRKHHTGDLIQLTAQYAAFTDIWLEGATDVNPTYGTTVGGAGIRMMDSNGYAFQWIGGGTINLDNAIIYEQDAGHSSRYIGLFLYAYTQNLAGTDPNLVALSADDTSAGFRLFDNCMIFGCVDISGAQDTIFSNCGMRSQISSDTTTIASLNGCILANSNRAQTIKGDNWFIMGCRISGSMTLAAGSFGVWAHNVFTFGTLTDNSGNIEVWDINHRVEDSNHRYQLMSHYMRIGFSGMVAVNATVYRGDVAASLYNTDAPTQVWNTPITADRAVTLNTGASMYNGERFRIVRKASATGAFNLNVGSGPLKALTPGTWCEVEYDGSSWNLIAAGTL